MIKLVEPTRRAGLAALSELLASKESKTQASYLAPFLGCHLITNSEVASRAFQELKPKDVESFLQEIYTRTYWKGWLEGRPQLYRIWHRLWQEDIRHWSERSEYQAALAGETGLKAFDQWVEDLKNTGELPSDILNAVASIWLFTLKLPWSLGVAFFRAHLRDRDVAVNLCRWRWIAGMHTTGKHQVVTAKKIKQLSTGKFFPEGQLNENPRPITGPVNPPYQAPIDFPVALSDQLGQEYALLLTAEDLSIESGPVSELKPKRVYWLDRDGEDVEVSDNVAEFRRDALADTVEQAKEKFGCPVESLGSAEMDLVDRLAQLKEEHAIDSLVYREPFVGPLKSLTTDLSVRDVGVRFFPLRHGWDSVLHPHTAKSYVHFHKFAHLRVLRSKGNL